jgi:parallel beta-helix repeat protein
MARTTSIRTPAKPVGLLTVLVLAATMLMLTNAGLARAAVTTLYVDGSSAACTDAGAGTATQPFCTIAKGASVATAGQTVQVAAGNYPQRVTLGHSGIAGSPIVITAAPDAIVTVGNGSSSAFAVSSRSYVTLQGFTVSRTTSHGISVGSSSFVTVSGMTVSNTTGYGISVSSSNNVTISGNDVSYTGQPVSGYTRYGIKLASTANSVVSDNVTHQNTDAGIFLDAATSGVQITGNTSYGNARGYVRAAPGIDVRGYSNTISRNISHDNEDSGLQFYSGSHDNLVAENLTYFNGDHGIDNLGSTNQTITGNTVWWNFAAGINAEGSSTRAVIQDNVADDNGYALSPCITGPCSARTRSDIRVDSTSTSGSTVNYNNTFNAISGYAVYFWGSTTYRSLSAYQTGTGQGLADQYGDPRFVSTSSRDFHLTPGSSAVDMANSAAAGWQLTDLDGNARVDDPTTVNTGAGPVTYGDAGVYELTP